MSQMERGAASRQHRVSGGRRYREETKSSPLAPREERDCPPNRPNRDAVNFRALPVLSRSEKTTLVSARLHELWQKKVLECDGLKACPTAGGPFGRAFCAGTFLLRSYSLSPLRVDRSRVGQNAGLPPGGRPALWRTRLQSRSPFSGVLRICRRKTEAAERL